jgi:hypothetical protein
MQDVVLQVGASSPRNEGKSSVESELSAQNENVLFVQRRNVRFRGWPRALWKRGESP